jgi:hypothetical protein
LDQMRRKSVSPTAKKDIKTRQHLMERSFARGERLGIKRARWRGLWRMKIQEYLTCAIQNIQVLISRTGPMKEAAFNAVRMNTKAVLSRTRKYLCLSFGLSFWRFGKRLGLRGTDYFEILNISNAACLN